MPYYQGTYLGTKRVLSIGAGFMFNKDGMYSRSTNGDSTVLATLVPPAGRTTDLFSAVPTRKHDIKLFGADVFYDVPLDTAARTALTIYGVYYKFNFGPNYVRYVGGENPGYGAVATRGNAYPQSGTGNAQYLNAGFLLPQNTLGPKVRLQPYIAYLHSSYEGLRKGNGERAGVNVYDAGVNVLLDGHNAKVTLNYRARPDFSDQTAIPSGALINNVKYRPEITLQTQVFL
ncbi:hypothetical protein [Hymenobacter volaticus]|uniref:TonB-dependent receptor n=1 Tax=Hymenobacter volaticus TaxID=2932254 RepID=A0ABY4GB87_9BACT|nr:hypothetical protein [Hymenobacter volaticus]UOQ68170.1 hypothetical protein MUN86_10130 [Hymenobacter volaticus]